jgi:membrane protease YdiL (CAAX protease family)
LSSPENPQLDRQSLNGEAEAPAPYVAVQFPPPLPQVILAPKAGENPVWSGWDVLLIAVFTVVLTFLVMPLLVVLAAQVLVYPHLSWAELIRKPVLALLSEFLAYIAVALYMILLIEMKYEKPFWQALRWNWPGIAGVSFLGVGVLMLGFDILGDRFLPMPKSTPFEQFLARPLDAYLTAAFAVSFGALMEELFFRGFLYPVVARRLGAVWGILITAVLFGLMHAPQYGYSWAAVLVVACVGIVLAMVRAMTKSVAASFLAHVGYNGTLMALAAWSTDGFKHMDKVGVGLF